MAHARQQLRDLIATSILEPIRTLTGPKEIYRSRVYPKQKFPTISVYTMRERYEVENPGYIVGDKPKIYRRWQQVVVEIIVQQNIDADNALDDFCVQVEKLIGNNDSMGGGAIATDLIATEIDVGPEGEQQTHTGRLVYEVEYRTDGNDPEQFRK